MAKERTLKEGLEFFPLDIDYFSDSKILKIESKYGFAGSIVATRLLCSIYRNGYYLKWNDDEALAIARLAGNGITWETVNEIVLGLIGCDFFDGQMFEAFGILTSRGIQQRWLKIITDCNRKARIKSDFNLLIQDEKSDLKAEKSEDSPQSKVKEIKVEESKAFESSTGLEKSDLEKVRMSAELTESLCGVFAVAPILTSNLYDSLLDYVDTVSNRNQLNTASLALKNYIEYKDRSQEQKHGLGKWIGTKDKFYQDGVWMEINWEAKNKQNGTSSGKNNQGTSTPASAVIAHGKGFGDLRRHREGRTNGK